EKMAPAEAKQQRQQHGWTPEKQRTHSSRSGTDEFFRKLFSRAGMDQNEVGFSPCGIFSRSTQWQALRNENRYGPQNTL
ncbi:MAG: hypothetical protein WA294_10165, partial [Acidobacteriaceae bacterium]